MEKLEQIKKAMDEIEKTLQEREEEFFAVSQKSGGYPMYEELRRPYTSRWSKLDREYRMLMVPEFEELPDYGEVMSLKDFIEECKSGNFIDYDGFGHYVKDNKESSIKIYPSDIEHKSIRPDFDTIIWFNR